jgi:hypothetical protein
MRISASEYNGMSIDEMNALIQEITAERDKRIKREQLAKRAEEYEEKIGDMIHTAQSCGLVVYIDGERVSTDGYAVRVYCK